MIVSGSLLFALAMWQLAQVTSQSGTQDFFWPLIWRGIGLGLVFVPLTTLTLSDIPPDEIAQASGLFNFFRQIGGSLGIAGMATLLTKYTSEGHAILAEHITAVDPTSQQRIGMLTRAFLARGADLASARRAAMAVIDRQIMGQASVIAFSKIYLLSGVILVISLPLLLLIHRSRAAMKVEVHME
jgi:DHA2 family multidrug resistance protein